MLPGLSRGKVAHGLILSLSLSDAMTIDYNLKGDDPVLFHVSIGRYCDDFHAMDLLLTTGIRVGHAVSEGSLLSSVGALTDVYPYASMPLGILGRLASGS